MAMQHLGIKSRRSQIPVLEEAVVLDDSEVRLALVEVNAQLNLLISEPKMAEDAWMGSVRLADYFRLDVHMKLRVPWNV